MSSLPQRAQGQWTLMAATGGPAVTFTSFLSMDLRAESQVVTGAIEEGSFASYNKVEQPLQIDVQLGIQGDAAELQDALATIDELQNSIDLLSLVTPNAEYTSLNLESYSYQRKREAGASVLWVDLALVEVKQVGQQYTNVRLARRTNRGKQQAKQQSALSGLLGKMRGNS